MDIIIYLSFDLDLDLDLISMDRNNEQLDKSLYMAFIYHIACLIYYSYANAKAGKAKAKVRLSERVRGFSFPQCSVV